MTDPHLASANLSWLELLDHIDQSLHHSLSRTPEFSPPPPAEPAPLPDALLRLEERLTAWQSCLDLALRKASEADALLASAEESLAAWQQNATTLREQWAKWEQEVA